MLSEIQLVFKYVLTVTVKLVLTFLLFTFTSENSIYAAGDLACVDENQNKFQKDLYTVLSLQQDKFYNFLPYESCNEKNNYLSDDIDKSILSIKPMHNSKLSPVCTFASLSHEVGAKFIKKCGEDLVSDKPCLSKGYHRFVHNQIVQAAECFNMDPKVLFSLYTTESYLQVNTKPGDKASARGIAQLLEAFKDINRPIGSQVLTKDTLYSKYLRYFQNKNSEIGPYCLDYYNDLNKIEKLESNDKCTQEGIEDRVKQDIYYSIAYRLLGVTLILEEMADKDLLFEGGSEEPYSTFLTSFGLEDSFKKEKPANTAEFINGKIENYKNKIDIVIPAVEDIIVNAKDTSKITDLMKYFGTVKSDSDSGCDAGDSYCELVNDPIVKNNCDGLVQPPNVDDYPNNNVNKFLGGLRSFIASARECRKNKTNVYLEMFHSLSEDKQKVLNEVAFYGHNKGTSIKEDFVGYLVKNPKVNYEKFSGTGKGSFREFLILNEGQHTQAINFISNSIANKKNVFDNSAVGHESSTRYNMQNVIRPKINGLGSEALSKFQADYLNKLKTDQGFKNKCSQY